MNEQYKQIETRIKQFEKFYHFLMKESPEDYIPWLFPCEPNRKNPSPSAILKIDSTSKGSWHHEKARLNKEQVIQHIKQGYNIGLSARKEDPLIIIDIDEKEYLNQIPKDTLIVTSRKRAGVHAFCWDKDGTAKINLPTDYGEVRSDNQYVLCCGSYVPFNLKNERDKKSFDELPKEAREDEFLGYYTIKESVYPKEISFNELPKFFIEKELENIEAEANIKNNNEEKNYMTGGKYDELFKLKVSDVVGLIPANKRKSHPLHESDTGANFSLSKDGKLAHCWRHLVSLNAVQYLCVKAGYKPCVDCGSPHKGRGISKIKGDKKALSVAYNEAVKLGLIKEVETIPEKIFTESGQAKHYIKERPIFYDKVGLWWMWNVDENFWERVDEVDILNMINASSGEDVVSPRKRTLILNSLKQEGRKSIPEDIKPNWIQCKDTIVDIISGERFSASPKYFVTNPIPWELSKYEDTPKIDKIFEEWVGKEYVKTLYEIIAYCLLSDYPIHRIFCLIGEGMNGKSKFLELLRNVVGKRNVCSTELDTLLTSRFEITRLHKKLICQMGETNFNEMNKTSILKKLSGGDLIGYEYKRADLFEEINYAKIIISTNNLPTTSDKTVGFYRRWCIIDFPNRFSEKKDVLEEIPKEEYNSLVSKCLIILKDLLEKREFNKEGTIEERMKKYEDRSDPLEKFIKEFTTEELDSYIWKNEFEKKLNEWCKENRFRNLSSVAIGKKMKERGIEQGQKYEEWMSEYGKKGGRAWLGISWINNSTNKVNKINR